MVPRVPAVVRGGNTIAARKSAQKHQRQVPLTSRYYTRKQCSYARILTFKEILDVKGNDSNMEAGFLMETYVSPSNRQFPDPETERGDAAEEMTKCYNRNRWTSTLLWMMTEQAAHKNAMIILLSSVGELYEGIDWINDLKQSHLRCLREHSLR
ncbi:hypothetical protein HOLleu_26365 [Holothuria leucospilota]|uniref:Uncharacterized protein n=1 Tax=Holothuria leucospilota TaxID=206669 RepID=A0A9Q1BTT0_HOLLE|nr:hypothetical protein HOLleu_26365 [Holothuria leucospilota]